MRWKGRVSREADGSMNSDCREAGSCAGPRPQFNERNLGNLALLPEAGNETLGDRLRFATCVCAGARADHGIVDLSTTISHTPCDWEEAFKLEKGV